MVYVGVPGHPVLYSETLSGSKYIIRLRSCVWVRPSVNTASNIHIVKPMLLDPELLGNTYSAKIIFLGHV